MSENPFYFNYTFSIYDLSRDIKKWWEFPMILIFKPTYVQVSDGYVWYYKIHSGAIYLIKYEEIRK